MAELSNGKDAQGRLVDPVTLARLKGGPPDYIGTILIGQIRYNPDGLRRLIDIANLGITIDFASREEWIISACLELGGDWEGDTRDDLEALDEDDDDYDEAQGLLGAYPNLKARNLPYGPAPTDAGNLWRRAQKLRDPITGLGFTETQAGIIYDNLHRGDEAAPAAAAEARHKGGTRSDKRRSKKRKKKLARKRKKARETARKEQQQRIKEKGYNANNQWEEEQQGDVWMPTPGHLPLSLMNAEAWRRRRKHWVWGDDREHNKMKGGNTPKSKTRKSKTRKSKTPKKSKTRKSKSRSPLKTTVKCSAFNTEKRDHKKMLEKEEKKRKKARVSRKKRQEKKRVKDMTERVVCEVRRIFSKRTPSPYDFEKEMREWLEREERKRRRRRTRGRKGGRRRKKRRRTRRTRR